MPEKIADRISITICGDGGCGKSSITLRLVRSQWISEYDPTIEDSYSVTRTVDGLSYHLSLTDTAGQEEYRGLWASSNLNSDAFLLVYDITNSLSLDGLQWFFDMVDIEAESRLEANNRLLREKGTRVRGRIEEGWKTPPVLIVVGNKCDLNEARVIPSKTGWDWARTRGCGFMETSAREMVNIEETFAWIVRKVVQARNADLKGSSLKKGHFASLSQSSSAPGMPYGVISAGPGNGPNTQQPPQSTRLREQESQAPLNEKSTFEADHPRWWRRILTYCDVGGCFGQRR